MMRDGTRIVVIQHKAFGAEGRTFYLLAGAAGDKEHEYVVAG